jgi:hypothetical protein
VCACRKFKPRHYLKSSLSRNDTALSRQFVLNACRTSVAQATPGMQNGTSLYSLAFTYLKDMTSVRFSWHDRGSSLKPHAVITRTVMYGREFQTSGLSFLKKNIWIINWSFFCRFFEDITPCSVVDTYIYIHMCVCVCVCVCLCVCVYVNQIIILGFIYRWVTGNGRFLNGCYGEGRGV